MKIGMELRHRKCLEVLKDVGVTPPTIPKGKKIVWKHFKTVDGFPALAINQTGIVPELRDNEEEVNGLSVMVALVDDLDNCPNAPKTLQRAFFTLIEATDNPVELSVISQEHGQTGNKNASKEESEKLSAEKMFFAVPSGIKSRIIRWANARGHKKYGTALRELMLEQLERDGF